MYSIRYFLKVFLSAFKPYTVNIDKISQVFTQLAGRKQYGKSDYKNNI